jgi:catechol 2,3-dioxygenase-like lactoylglutathione lyase family enzyme
VIRPALAIVAALSTTGAAMAQTAGPPAALRPAAVAGAGFNVADLAAARDWYQSKLGMRVLFTVPKDGKPYEHIMTLGEGKGRAVLALVQVDKRPPGPNPFGRVILQVPDGKALAAWLKTQGVQTREIVPNVAYMLTDPEGNPVELYTPAKR